MDGVYANSFGEDEKYNRTFNLKYSLDNKIIVITFEYTIPYNVT
jgi:hypothetical protein